MNFRMDKPYLFSKECLLSVHFGMQVIHKRQHAQTASARKSGLLSADECILDILTVSNSLHYEQSVQNRYDESFT